jgi:hypothetical protein
LLASVVLSTFFQIPFAAVTRKPFREEAKLIVRFNSNPGTVILMDVPTGSPANCILLWATLVASGVPAMAICHQHIAY